MITARDKNGKAIFATRDAEGHSPEAYCPCCLKRMRARVGDVRRPHWAHESCERCDEWWEEESEWRNAWITELTGSDKIDVENVLEKDGERHFYDARFNEKTIAIFRRGRLSIEQIRAREQFFGEMFWFVEGKESEFGRLNSHLESGALVPVPNAQRCYEYKMLPATPFFSRWADCRMPVVFDFSAASGSPDKPLWCVLPRHMAGRLILSFPKEDFLSRLKESGALLNGSVNDVVTRVREREAAYRAKIQEERATKLSHVQSHLSVARPIPAAAATVTQRANSVCDSISDVVIVPRKKKKKSWNAPVSCPPAKTYEEYLAEYLSYGFSQGDAEYRARMKAGVGSNVE